MGVSALIGELDRRLDPVRLLLVRATCALIIQILQLLDATAAAAIRIKRAYAPESKGDQRRSTLVIVGAGLSGLRAQRECSDECHVTLVDRKEYFEYTPGCLRLFVDPAHFSNLAKPLPRHRNGLVVGSLTSIGSNAITVRDHGGVDVLISYDYLMLATGGTYGCEPITPTAAQPTLDARRAVWESAAEKLRNARSVIVIGGGPVGVELAAEIVYAYPHKLVTLLTADDELCSSLPMQVGAVCASWLRSRGARLIFNSRVTRINAKSVELADSSILSADIVYPCMGASAPCTSALRTSLPQSLDERGRILVDKSLRVHGTSGRVFAMGDAMTLPGCSDLKLGHTAELNAEVAAQNVLRSNSGAERLEVYPYGAVGADIAPRVFAVSLGEAGGVLAFNGIVVSGMLAAVVKRLIEWTKVAACEERPIGIHIWRFGDAMTNWLSRTIIPPP